MSIKLKQNIIYILKLKAFKLYTIKNKIASFL